MSKFVIVVDAQYDFIHPQGKLYINNADSVIKPINNYLASLTNESCAGVLFTLDTHEAPQYLQSSEYLEDSFPIHCEKGSPGHQLVVDVAKIKPDIPIYTLEKSVFDMWLEDGLQVKSLGLEQTTEQERNSFFKAIFTSGVTEVVLMGVASDYCVKYTLEGLLHYKHKLTLLALGTYGISQSIDEVVKQYFKQNSLINII